MKEKRLSNDILGPMVRKDTADQIRKLRKEGNRETAKELSHKHYERAKNISEAVESQKKERSVSEWTKKGLVFAHGMPLLEGQNLKSSSSGNNPELKGKQLDSSERLKLILDKQPTLSVSTITGKRYRLGSAYPTGVFLSDGFIQQGYASDGGTIALGRDTRVSKYAQPQERVKIQAQVDVKRIEEEMDKYGEELNRSKRPSMYHYNEYVVSNPAVPALFIDLDYYDPSKRMGEIRQQIGDLRFQKMPDKDKEYMQKSITEEKNKSLLKLKELSLTFGLPVVGLRSLDNKLNMSELNINDENYKKLALKKEKLIDEMNKLVETVDTFDPLIDQKYEQIEQTEKQIAEAEEKLEFSESSYKLPTDAVEAESARRKHLVKSINNI